jgi:multicomponent Na+:H+ antiporter subunit C
MIAGRTAAILTDGGANPDLYVNPIPAGLVLTGIVVSVSVSAFSLALIQRIYGSYGTVDMRELLTLMKKRGE